MEEIKKYLSENLRINIHYVGDRTLEVRLLLEKEVISSDYIYYRK